MKINNLQPYSYNNTFKGTVDKSLIEYTKLISDSAKYTPKKMELVNKTINQILTRLQTFMLKTSKKTTLFLEESNIRFTDICDQALYSLYFKNSKYNTKVRAHRPDFTIKDSTPMISQNGIRIVSPTLYGQNAKYTGLAFQYYDKIEVENNLSELDNWSKELVKNVNPEELDKYLTDSEK